MNLVFDPADWSAALTHFARQDADAHPEWHGLRTQMRTALELWQALAPASPARTKGRFGSFSRRAARSLDRIAGDCASVNQTSSGNFKPGSAMLVRVDVTTNADGRRQA
jgi:hypothetical protein